MPAEHETWIDHEMELPNATLNAERLFSGQKFVLTRLLNIQLEQFFSFSSQFTQLGDKVALSLIRQHRCLWRSCGHRR